MKLALTNLLVDASQWAICIKRWEVDLRSGEKRSPSLLIRDLEEIADKDGGVAGSILKCRQATVFATWDDHSSVIIDLTKRVFSILTYSQSVGARMWRFCDDLKNGARSRVVTREGALLLLVLPSVVIVAIAAIADNSDPALRQYIARHPNGSNLVAWPIPYWLYDAVLVYRVVAIICALLMLAVVAIRVNSGGCRIWPRILSGNFVLNLMYRIRSEVSRAESWRTAIIGITSGLLLALLTSYLLH